MSLRILALWALNIVADTIGQLAFKAGSLGENHHEGARYFLKILRNRWIWLGIGCYGIEFFLWLGFLSLVPLSNGVLLGSFNIVVVLIAGRCLFRESITLGKITGIVLVTLGVILVGLDT